MNSVIMSCTNPRHVSTGVKSIANRIWLTSLLCELAHNSQDIIVIIQIEYGRCSRDGQAGNAGGIMS